MVVVLCSIQLDVMVLLNVFIFWAFSCWTDSWYTHIIHFTRDQHHPQYTAYFNYSVTLCMKCALLASLPVPFYTTSSTRCLQSCHNVKGAHIHTFNGPLSGITLVSW